MLKKYRIGFEIWGLVLFFLIMLPNFVWFVVPAPNDILRNKSITSELDMIASICQILMVLAICVIVNRDSKKLKIKNPSIILVILCCIFYFITWALYYYGMVNTVIILSLCIFPCLAFLLYEMDRKNGIAVIPTIIFTICHITYGIVNFIL